MTDGRRVFRLAFDLTVVVFETVFFGALVSRWEDLTFKLILPAYVLYCFGLVFKVRDREYLRGLSWFSRKRLFWIGTFLLLQTTLGALAFGSLMVILDMKKPSGGMVVLSVVSLLVLFPLALAMTIRLLLRARKAFPDPFPERNDGSRGGRPAVSDLGIWAMGLVLLAFFYSLAPRSSVAGGGSVFSVLGAFILIAALGLLFYYPARFHYILEDHRDPWNWVGFFSSMIFFALFLLRGAR